MRRGSCSPRPRWAWRVGGGIRVRETGGWGLMRMDRARRRVVAWCFVACCALPVATCYGWSTKEHILLTRLAAIRLIENDQTPPEMKAWLRDGLAGWATEIDAQR